jgi:hypothetical protein
MVGVRALRVGGCPFLAGGLLLTADARRARYPGPTRKV